MKSGIFLFLVAVLAVPIVALAGGKVHVCHRDQGHPEWKEIEIAESALSAHLAHQWGADIYPVPADGCPGGTPTPDPTATLVPPTETPTATPTPTPVVTEAPTETPVPPTEEPTPQTPPTDEGCPADVICYQGLG
jgi:hypothetical protein